jgi:hypothetical protein
MKGRTLRWEIIFCLLWAYNGIGQRPTVVTHHPFHVAENLRSASITDANGSPQFPLLSLQGGSLLFQFDLIQDDREWLKYRLIASDMLGKPLEIDPSELVSGFYESEVSNAELAFNTTTDYVHFALNFPNDMMKPLVAGRYWLLFYRNDDYQDPDNQVMAFPLFVSSDKISLTARQLKSNDVSCIYTHQQIETIALPNGMNFNDIPRDIRVMILKNHELQSDLPPIAPTFITPERWTFQHNDLPGCSGGNEWRVMDTRQIVTPGFHIDHTLPNQDNPEIWVQQDESNAKSKYGWNDMNGITAFCTSLPSPLSLDADYLLTYFQYKARRFEEGDVYLEYYTSLGCKEEIILYYNENTGCYETKIFLKQGIYNYRYRWKNSYSSGDELKYTEGNFADTQNRYGVFLFQKDRLYGHDRILGTYWIK